MEKNQVTSRSYTLHTENGSWLGQVVLTSDGMFASVTDYGNLSYAWRHFGDEDFRKFLLGLNTDYFATKMYQGMAYILYGKKCEKACTRFAEMILPALQKVLREEISEETSSQKDSMIFVFQPETNNFLCKVTRD